MGAGIAKLLPYLDAGPEEKEDKLKKSYAMILTSGKAPTKPILTWKSLSLKSGDVDSTVRSLIEGAHFIHAARMTKKNTYVSAPEDDIDAVVFATAYIMILSGLPADRADQAVTNAFKEANHRFEKKYYKALEALRELKPAKEMREELLRSVGQYPYKALADDVSKIYELAGLSQPSDKQIQLEEPYHLSERKMSVSSRKFSRDDSRKTSKSNTPSPKHSTASMDRKPDRRESQDSKHSDKRRPEPIDLINGVGQHVDSALLKNPPRIDQAKPEVTFDGLPGESDKSSTRNVTELNSARTMGEGLSYQSSSQVPKNEPVSLSSNAKPPSSPPPVESPTRKTSSGFVGKLKNLIEKPKGEHKEDKLKIEATNIQSSAKSPTSDATPEEPSAPMNSTAMLNRMKDAIERPKKEPNDDRAQVATSSLLFGAKPPSNAQNTGVSGDSMSMLAQIKQSMDKPTAPPHQNKRPDSVINGDAGTNRRSIKIIRRTDENREALKRATQILAKKAMESQGQTETRRPIKIIRAFNKH